MSFVIYNGTGFNLQSIAIGDQLKYIYASDIRVSVKDQYGLPEQALRSFLSTYNEQYPLHI